jgi:hypothetical protein
VWADHVSVLGLGAGGFRADLAAARSLDQLDERLDSIAVQLDREPARLAEEL